MTKVQDCGLEVSEFKLRAFYQVNFRINTLEKVDYQLITFFIF